MNWHSIASFGLGFALMPAVFSLVGIFVYLGVTYKLNNTLTAAGAITAVAVVISAAAAALVVAAAYR